MQGRCGEQRFAVCGMHDGLKRVESLLVILEDDQTGHTLSLQVRFLECQISVHFCRLYLEVERVY